MSKVSELKRVEQCPGEPYRYTARDWPSALNTDEKYLLPFDVEQQLVDDLAFIASYEEGTHMVTAAAIECGQAGSACVVRLAANEGIQKPVRRLFEDIFVKLKLCANAGKSSSESYITIAADAHRRGIATVVR